MLSNCSKSLVSIPIRSLRFRSIGYAANTLNPNSDTRSNNLAEPTLGDRFISPNQLTPYITEIFTNSSISISLDSIKDKTQALENAVSAFLKYPTRSVYQTDLVGLFTSLKKSLSSREMTEFLETAYFMLVYQHVCDGDAQKAIQTHKYLMSLSDDIKPKITRFQWLKFVRKVLQTQNQKSLDALFSVYKMQPEHLTSNTFKDFSVWFADLSRVKDIVPIKLWMIRLLCAGDIPRTGWEVHVFLSILFKSPSIDCISDYDVELYRSLIRSSRKGSIDYISLAQTGVLMSLANLQGTKNSTTGFEYTSAMSRAMMLSRSLSPTQEEPPYNLKILENDASSPPMRVAHPIIRSFWYNAIYNHKNVSIDTFLSYFEKNRIELTPALLQRLVMKSKTMNEFCQYYEHVYNRKFSAFFDMSYREQSTAPKLPDTLLNEIAPDLTMKFYAHSVKLLCQNNVKSAQTLMSDPIAYNDPDMVRGFLLGLQNVGKFKRLVDYCERILLQSKNRQVMKIFWMYYLPALVRVRETETAAYLMTAMLLKRLQGSHNKKKTTLGAQLLALKPEAIVRAPSKVSKLRLEAFDDEILANAPLPNAVFDKVVDAIMTHGRTNISYKRAQSKKLREKEYSPTEIVQVLKLGYTVSQLVPCITPKGQDALFAHEYPYQLSPKSLVKFLAHIQTRQVIVNREDFIEIYAGILKIYPNYYEPHYSLPKKPAPDQSSHRRSASPALDIMSLESPKEDNTHSQPKSWYQYPAGTHFRSSYFSNEAVELVIYIGILLCPAKIWWVLSYLQHLAASLDLNVEKEHVKAVLLGSISQIYGYDKVSGELSRVRSQACNRTSLQDLVDILNMIWGGSRMEEIDVFLKKKGINSEKLVTRQLMKLNQDIQRY